MKGVWASVIVAVIALAVILTWLNGRRSGDADSRLAEAAKRYEQAVALVVVDKPTGENTVQQIPFATAWAVRPGVFASNAHVTQRAKRLLSDGYRVYLVVNRRPELKIPVYDAISHHRFGNVACADRQAACVPFAYDVGVLLAAGETPESFPIANKGELAAIGAGYRVAYLGFPMEQLVHGGVDCSSPVANMQSGIITAVSDFSQGEGGPEGNVLIRHNLGTTGGASGSPLFNENGEVVAIVNAMNVIRQGASGASEGNPIRAPSAAMINFAQRVDLLTEVETQAGENDDRKGLWADAQAGDEGLFPMLATLGAPLAPIVSSLSAAVVDQGLEDFTCSPPKLPAIPRGVQRKVRSSYRSGTNRVVRFYDADENWFAERLYHDNGAVSEHCPILNGQIHGCMYKLTRAEHVFASLEFVAGRLHGIHRRHNILTGQVWMKARYENGQCVEQPTYFDLHGRRASGSLTIYYITNDGKAVSQGVAKRLPIKNGRVNGTLIAYYQTGERSAEVEFLDGLEHGAGRFYTRQGKLSREMAYRNGKLHGETRFYGEKGNVLSRCTYIEGRRDGIEIVWSKDGSQVRIVQWENGKRAKLNRDSIPPAVLKPQA